MARTTVKITGKVSTGNGKKVTAGTKGKRLYQSRAKLTTHIHDGRA
jgi:hypothetical protein